MNLDEAKIEVYQLAICGASSEGVSEKLGQAGFNETEILEVFDDTIERLRKLAIVDREIEKGRAVARLDMIFLNCIKSGDMPTALKTQREIIDLLQLKKLSPANGGASSLATLKPAKL